MQEGDNLVHTLSRYHLEPLLYSEVLNIANAFMIVYHMIIFSCSIVTVVKYEVFEFYTYNQMHNAGFTDP